MTDLYYKDSNLHITKENWDELKKNKTSIAFNGVVAAAKETISQRGAFIIYCKDTTEIQCRCDRLSDLEDEINTPSDVSE
jgi:hypothetical protein